MNDFDFFTVNASSSRITSLMKLPNVKRSNIEHRVYYDATSKFPKHLYKVTLGFYDVMEFGHFGARKRANEHVEVILATKPADVILSTKFFPRD
jgi:alkyl sulfatase BDS1-like metallo-beta-lactamase superfamily hydrolase